jgi:hypothetical protein
MEPDRRGFLGAVAGVAAGAMLPVPVAPQKLVPQRLYVTNWDRFTTVHYPPLNKTERAALVRRIVAAMENTTMQPPIPRHV